MMTGGLAPRLIEANGAPDYGAALAGLAPGEAVVIAESPLFVHDRVALGNLMLERHVPSVWPAREDAEAGALLAYGVNIRAGLVSFHDFRWWHDSEL